MNKLKFFQYYISYLGAEILLYILKQKYQYMKALIFKRNIWFLLIILSLFIFTGCAQREVVEKCLTGHEYGFFGGLWHGFIAPFDFIGMLFNQNITMYAQNNNGGLYALGFLLGSGGWGFFGSKGAKRARRNRGSVQAETFEDARVIE